MSTTTPTGSPYVQPGEPLHEFLRSFWQRQIDAAETEAIDYRHPPLPLARIKKVMKSDPDVKMIAADAPILFCKACEIFISEITARAFIIADSNKRRTLSRSDIAKALGKSDQFDFLIDIVPRDDAPLGVPGSAQHTLNLGVGVGAGGEQQQHQGIDDGNGREQPRSVEMENGEDEENPEDDRRRHSAEVLDQLQTLLNHGASR